jgi:hypothetical protein
MAYALRKKTQEKKDKDAQEKEKAAQRQAQEEVNATK